MKECKSCNIEKELTEFTKSKNYKDGYTNQCRECRKSLRRLNAVKERQQCREYYYRNREEVLKQKSEYHSRPQTKVRKNLYNKKRRKTDRLYKIKDCIRRRINTYVKEKKKSTLECLGCTTEFFMDYIESQFKDGMTWDNHGRDGWHLDHIIPLASANTEEEIYKLNHYTNFQPLWAEENMKKSDKIFDLS